MPAPATASASSAITAPSMDDQSRSTDHCNTKIPSRIDLLDNIDLLTYPHLDHVFANDMQSGGFQNVPGGVFGNAEWDIDFTPNDLIDMQTHSFPINDQASHFLFGGLTPDLSSNSQIPGFIDTCQASRLPTYGQNPNTLINDRNFCNSNFEDGGFNGKFDMSANGAPVVERQLPSTYANLQITTPGPRTLTTNHVSLIRPHQYIQPILPKPHGSSLLQNPEPIQAGTLLTQQSWELNPVGKRIAPSEQGPVQPRKIILKKAGGVSPSIANKIYGSKVVKRAKKGQNAMLEPYCFDFASRPQPVREKATRRKGVRSCLACNEKHLKVFTLPLYSRLKTLISNIVYRWVSLYKLQEPSSPYDDQIFSIFIILDGIV